jgi:hypothetical protein
VSRVDTAGVLLVASLALWLPAALLPAAIWTAPPAERLALIARQRRRWQLVNASIAAAGLALVLGVAALAEPVRGEGPATLADLALVLLVVGVPLWLASLVHRIAVVEDGAAWAGALFLAWSVLANVACAGLGAAVVRSGVAPAWTGWAVVACAGLILVQLALTGDALPAAYHLGPAILGIALLVD